MIVRVNSNNISFGCMQGKNIGNGNDVSIIVYENMFTQISFVPQKNELLLCEYYHTSVYKPIALIDENNLFLRKTHLPNDILMCYFPCIMKYRT